MSMRNQTSVRLDGGKTPQNLTLTIKPGGEEGASLVAPINIPPPFDLNLVTNRGVSGGTLQMMYATALRSSGLSTGANLTSMAA